MGKSNANWEPNIKDAYRKQKKQKYGVDAVSDDRYADLGKNARNKKGFGKVIVIIIILLIVFDALFMKGELFINILKELIKR